MIGQTLDALMQALPAKTVSLPDQIEPRYLSDWSGIDTQKPKALIRPQSTEEVVTALSICHANGQPVTPQGGRTGLNGSAAPRHGEIIMSMERLSGIEEFDETEGTILVRAGTTLETIQQTAAQSGWLMPLDIGARGSCHIGGNISTNAGGNRVIRYGTTRQMILGLEAVLADGTLLTDLAPMVKNNAGYNLNQLFIGTEGTLGIVTRARIRLVPQPVARVTALVSADDFQQVRRLLGASSSDLGGTLSSFEVMWQSFYKLIAEGCFQGRAPMPLDRGIYVLLETHCSDEEQGLSTMESFLASALEDGLINDAIIAQSMQQAADLWAIRDATGELNHLMEEHIPYDIGLPISQMDEFVAKCSAALRKAIGDNAQVYYGHLGDGNLHLNVDAKGAGDSKDQSHRIVDQIVYEQVRDQKGTITAEHGVGILKKNYLAFCRSPSQIATMRAIKTALDPNNILNPGRIIDLD